MTERGIPWSQDATVDARVEALLQQWTLEQKVALVSGKLGVEDDPQPTPLPGSRLFSLSDGPAGVRIPDRAMPAGNTTALPAPIALAATWNPELARQYGDVIGAEAAAHGHNVLLGPAVDIARVPLAGRTFESFGEDPLLQARMVVPEIEAIQAHAVQACLKHYIVNNQEYQRGAVDEVVQLYVRHLDSAVERPFQELKGFTRISLQPCETRTVALDLSAGDLAYWNGTRQRFEVESGPIQVRVGQSSEHIHLEQTIEVVPASRADESPPE